MYPRQEWQQTRPFARVLLFLGQEATSEIVLDRFLSVPEDGCYGYGPGSYLQDLEIYLRMTAELSVFLEPHFPSSWTALAPGTNLRRGFAEAPPDFCLSQALLRRPLSVPPSRCLQQISLVNYSGYCPRISQCKQPEDYFKRTRAKHARHKCLLELRHAFLLQIATRSFLLLEKFHPTEKSNSESRAQRCFEKPP